MSDTPERKRVRQACLACRRIKGRCPGEKPSCSRCVRLGQVCFYAGETVSEDSTPDTIGRGLNPQHGVEHLSNSLSSEIQSLHSKVDDVLSHLKNLSEPTPHARVEPPAETSQTTLNHGLVSNATSKAENGDTLLPRNLIQESAQLYIKYLHCQPLQIFSLTNFVSTFSRRDTELVLCIVGLTQRFRASEISLGTHHLERARDLVMSRIRDRPIQLSTIQCLLLLSLSSFFDGKRQMASLTLSMALDIARSARLERYGLSASVLPSHEEHVRTLWSIIMLQYLIGGSGLFSTIIDIKGLRFPAIDGRNDLAIVEDSVFSDTGVVSYALQMTEVWYRVRQWVRHRGNRDTFPPWSERSQFSAILYRQMELESQMPHRHRFNPSRFAEQYVATLSTNREYWAPWLYLQMIYHTAMCTLNHPILLSVHLRRFKVNQIPELFLQHTADIIGSHTDWMVHLITIASEKGFEFSNPALGQCVAIIGTIFLQQSYTEDADVRADKQRKYAECLRFVEGLSKYWPAVQAWVDDLKSLESTITRAYNTSAEQSPNHESKKVDLAALWRIMDNMDVSSSSDRHNHFGLTLLSGEAETNNSGHLSTRPLPEPTRVRPLSTHGTTAASTPITPLDLARNEDDAILLQDSLVYDPAFLAEDYFSLGQDFVGNVDDWFSWNANGT